jgi:hypothetical protein
VITSETRYETSGPNSSAKQAGSILADPCRRRSAWTVSVPQHARRGRLLSDADQTGDSS